MAKPAARVGFIQFCLFLGGLAILGKAARLQLVEGDRWAAEAEQGRTVREELPAGRGTIFDRSGVELVVSQERYHISIAPEQVRDTSTFARRVGRAIGESPDRLARAIGSGRRSVYLAGPYDALAVEPIRTLRGVSLTPVFRRVGRTDLARATVGALHPDSSSGLSGIERSLDSLLAGVPGETVRLRDKWGRRYDSPGRPTRRPVRGHDVWLTIDARLQEIAEAALDNAIAEMDAKGGDVVFLDPATGELLAVASRVEGERSTATAFTSTFEPGSTAKLFTAAALLRHGLVDSTDRVSGENGNWLFQPPVGRPYRITDVHIAREPMTLETAVALSSNIGMAKFSQRLRPEQQYDMLRDFGFSTRTGVEFPGEEDGYVPNPARPREWSPASTRESLSRGYGMSVTAIQLAAAYGAIANGGLLLTPTLVREIRSPEGSVLYRHRPEPVRRVLDPEIAATLRRYMRKAVSTGGTSDKAVIETYELAGKTGTARKVVNRRYAIGKYFSSFAAVWPADRPELVAIVTIDEPRGAYYGSQTAAPLTQKILQEALASRNRALDLDRLARRDTTTRPAPKARPAPMAPRDPLPLVAVTWPAPPPDTSRREAPLPDVTGVPTRAAISRLHAAGFRVAVEGSGLISRMAPAGGTRFRTGETVTLWAEPPRLP